jgi:hypothetical protein
MDCIIFYQPGRDSTAPASKAKVNPSPLPSGKSWTAAPRGKQSSSNARCGIEVVDLTDPDRESMSPQCATTCQPVHNGGKGVSLSDAADAADAVNAVTGTCVGFIPGGSQGEPMRRVFGSSVRIYMAFQISRLS